MEQYSKTEVQELKQQVDRFTAKHQITVQQLLAFLDSSDKIPVGIFNERLSPLETVVKFLRENRGLRIAEVARTLRKQNSSVWLAYRNAQRKVSKRLSFTPSEYDVPLEAFETDAFSVLEVVCCYLKDSQHLTYRDIGGLLHRDERTVWTTYRRALGRRRR